MKERTSRTKVIGTVGTLKSTERTRSEPNLFPPINSHHGNRGTLRTLSGPRDQLLQEPVRTSGHPLPSRSVLYRNWGLVTNGNRGARVLNEEPPETALSSNIGRSTPKRKPAKVSVKYDVKKREITPRSPFNAAGHTGVRDDNGAVRKKIEEFRQWHEEQYRQKLETLKARAEQETNGRIKAAEALALANMYKDKVTPLHDNNITENGGHLGVNHEPADIAQPDEIPRTAGESLPRLASRGVQPSAKLEKYPELDRTSRGLTSSRADSPPAAIPSELKQRVYSAKTWRTWRHANQSDAYKDVATYIKDNDLLEDDKVRHIRDWIQSVEEARISGECIGTDGRRIASDYIASDTMSSTTAES